MHGRSGTCSSTAPWIAPGLSTSAAWSVPAGSSCASIQWRPKRALRALLKATDVCALEPERVARRLVDRGFTNRYDYALQTLKELPYNRWREYDPEDAVRFYALRLHESGLIRSSPQKIIAQGTDWRFLNELKKELKA